MNETKKCAWKYSAERDNESKLYNKINHLGSKKGRQITFDSNKPCYDCEGYNLTCEYYQVKPRIKNVK